MRPDDVCVCGRFRRDHGTTRALRGHRFLFYARHRPAAASQLELFP